ncbi:Hypothetical protein SMAX5B_018487 [Scophthalmus maximus]|uniref:Uncharacterized protein n=1 Tax=Scophthalmus maximus TaxID=52904 RepID=A0A2U9C8B1_SCOMX|nr:Hypothetical protein SMAX5B_018487 [Scophthalmus maximus]
MPSHLVLDHLHLRMTSSRRGSVPATPTCLVRCNSVWYILSPRCGPQSSANCAILSAAAPPKLPFCCDQTRSQCERVPAPTNLPPPC